VKIKMNNALENLYNVVLERQATYKEIGLVPDENGKNSYTCYLFSKGEDKILKKCGEECTEMVIAAKNNDNFELKNEISDLLYHIMVLCAEKNLPLSEVLEELDERSQKIGNCKVFKNTNKNS
jgi:phosphoribosyl-ATP pyrophosphohydrolase